MALAFNLPSQIVVQTSAQWAVDTTIYSNKRLLITSDLFYGTTDQRKTKLADGTQTWAQLDYLPISGFDDATSSIQTQLNAKQPIDADLTSIAGLGFASTSFLKKTGANTWALDTNSYVSGTGTTNRSAKFTASGVIGNGAWTDTGSVLTASPSTNFNVNVGNGTLGLVSTGILTIQSTFDYINMIGDVEVAGGLSLTSSLNAGANNGFIAPISLQAAATLITGSISGQIEYNGTNLYLTDSTNTRRAFQYALTLTTTGSSGAATLIGNTLNIPQYSGGGGGLTVGTTTITGGAATRILYNNAGLVGEYSLTGTGTVVAMGTSPTFTTSTATTAITATTITADVLQTLTNNSSATPTAGYGLSRLIQLKSTTTDSQIAGKEIWEWTTATHASRQSGYRIQLVGNASVGTLQDAFKIRNNGNSFQFDLINHTGFDPVLNFMSGTTPICNIQSAGNDMYYSTMNSPAATMYFRLGSASIMVRLNTTGMFLGGSTSPTAKLHLAAGTTTASTAPIKLTAGTNMTIVENGAFEYDGTNLYFTTGGVRKTVTLT